MNRQINEQTYEEMKKQINEGTKKQMNAWNIHLIIKNKCNDQTKKQKKNEQMNAPVNKQKDVLQ